jgi:hypothetical protein
VVVVEPPKVVEGTVIRTSRSELLFLGACSGLLAFAAAFLLWDTWGHENGRHILPFQLAKDSLLTSFAVVLCGVGGVGCTIALAYKGLFPHRLVLGKEVLQVVRTGLLGPTVETQVPYANIAVVLCEGDTQGFGEVRIGIDLHCLSAPGTYSSRSDFGRKDRNGRDWYLPRFLRAEPKEIARLIEERRQGGERVGAEEGAAADRPRN